MEGHAFAEGSWWTGYVVGVDVGLDVHVSKSINVGPLFMVFGYQEFGASGKSLRRRSSI